MVQSRKPELGGFKPWRAYYDALEVNVIHDMGTYVVTQKQIDDQRISLDDPGARFPDPRPTAEHGRPGRQLRDAGPVGIQPPSSVNARSMKEYFNPAVPGKPLHVTHRIVEKYIRRDLPYYTEEITTTDEGGRLVERMTVTHMIRGGTLGEKWTQDAQEANKKFTAWVKDHPESL